MEELRIGGRATVLAGRCLERENVPYKGFDALVDELSRYLRKLPAQDAAALLPREVYALARIFPVLDRIPVVSKAPKKHVPDPQDLKQRAVEAFGELIARIRDRGPLVLLIDDLQWIDRDSMRFMRALCLQRDPAPVVVVCAHRSEGAGTHELLQAVIQGAEDNAALEVRRLGLSALPHGALVSLAQRLLPSGADPRAADTFATEARGSPFFAAELARAASLARNPEKLSLAEALSLHVASLPVEAQTLLSLLALAGEPLSPQVASEAASLSDGHAALDRLRNEQLVRVSFDAEGERRLECYHDKIREHVGGALDPLRARELALGLSRALLAHADADPELLARVLELAGLVEQAAEHAARAAERAFAALAFERAAMLYEKALAHGIFEPARVQAMRVGRAEALGCAGMGVRAAEAFLAAAESASGDQALVLLRKAGEQYLLCGEVELGHALLSQVLSKVGVSFPRSLAAALASVGFWRSRLRLRRLHYTPRTDQSPATMRKLELLRTVTHCLVRCDEVRAAAFSARWVLFALASGHEVEIARALAWELHIAARLGQPEPVLDEIRSLCAQLCERTRDPNASSSGASWSRVRSKRPLVAWPRPPHPRLRRRLNAARSHAPRNGSRCARCASPGIPVLLQYSVACMASVMMRSPRSARFSAQPCLHSGHRSGAAVSASCSAAMRAPR